jgi:hypothetical protein
MMNSTFFLAGSIIVLVWGIAHLVPTKSVVKGFGEISRDNKRIITMEWLAESVALCFIGLLGLLVTIYGDPASFTAAIVYRASGGSLIAIAVVAGLTGARTSIIPIKICPVIVSIAAALFLAGSVS